MKRLLFCLMACAAVLSAAVSLTACSGNESESGLFHELSLRQRSQLRIQMNDSSVILSRRPLGVKVQNTPDGVIVYSGAKNICFQVEGSRSGAPLRIYSKHPFILRLNNLHLSNPNGPAIDISSRQTAVLVLVGESELSDGREYSLKSQIDDLKSCITSKGDLIFCGDGSLSLKGNYGHAIKSEGSIRVTQNAVIRVLSAVKDGLNVSSNLIIDGGQVDVTSSDDGIKCDGTLVIKGGNTVIKALGGEGSEGMEGDMVYIQGGSLRVLSSDDAINAKRDITIDGGLVYAYSTRNDAVDANGSIKLNGGTLVAFGSQIPEGGIDCDWNPITVSGGTALCMGGDNSRPSESSALQPVVLYGTDAMEKGDRISLTDDSDSVVFSVALPRDYFRASVLYTSSYLERGHSYKFSIGGVCQDGNCIYGVASDACLLDGIVKDSFSINSMVVTVGNVGGPMGGPGGPMGNPMGGPGGEPGGPMDFRPMEGFGGPMGGPGGPMGGPGGPMEFGPMGGPNGPAGQDVIPADFPPELPE